MDWKSKKKEGKKDKRGKRIVIGSLIMVLIVFASAFLVNQSYSAKQAIRKSSKGESDLVCEKIIYQKGLKDGRELIVYGNPEGEICSAIVKRTNIFYKTEHMLGGMSGEVMGGKKVNMELVSYDTYRFYLIGIFADEAVSSVRYGDQVMEMTEYEGTRVVIAVDEDETFNPKYYSKGFDVLDQDGNVLESEPRRWQ